MVYVDKGFSERFRPVPDVCFYVKTTANHYLHQADLKKRQKVETPKVKHYLYSLQHIAAAKWVLQHYAPVPFSFRMLMEYWPESIQEYAEILLKQKVTLPDVPFTTCIPEPENSLIQERDCISNEIESLPIEIKIDWDLLNRFFLSELQQ